MTKLTFPLQSVENYPILLIPTSYPVGSEVDFRVQAIAGYYQPVYPLFTPVLNPLPDVFKSNSSDWSIIQTITISSNSRSPSPSIPELTYCTLPIIVIVGIVSMIALVSLKSVSTF